MTDFYELHIIKGKYPWDRRSHMNYLVTVMFGCNESGVVEIGEVGHLRLEFASKIGLEVTACKKLKIDHM
jgi:hypothetical protein